MDLQQILEKKLRVILSPAPGTGIPGCTPPFVPSHMDHFRFHHLNVFIENIKNKVIGCRIGRAVCTGPLRILYIRQLPVTCQEVISMRQGGNLRDHLEIILVAEFHHVPDFLFFEDPAIPCIPVIGVLIIATGTKGIVTPRKIQFPGKFNPSRIQLGMPVKAHDGIDFNDDFVEFVECHEIPDEPFKKGHILPSRDIELYPAERHIRPVADIHARHCDPVVFLYELPQRLKPVKSTLAVTSCYHNISGGDL